jgi:hypothetical protein
MDFTIDIDTGGSFTDGFITAGDNVYQIKVPFFSFVSPIEIEGNPRFPQFLLDSMGVGACFYLKSAVVNYQFAVHEKSIHPAP